MFDCFEQLNGRTRRGPVAQLAAPPRKKLQRLMKNLLKELRVYGGLRGGVKARTPAALAAFSVEN
jgi:hypothetical protein